MTDDGALLSRRALLAAGLGGVALVTACTTRTPKPVHDPDGPAIDAARATELSLLQTYAENTPAHAAHLAHLHALGGTLPTGTPAPSPSASVPSAEAVTVAPLLEAARHAQRGSTAAVLASIAASHAVMSGIRPG